MQNGMKETLSHAELVTGRDEGFLRREGERRIGLFLGRETTLPDKDVYELVDYTMDEVRDAIYALSRRSVRVLFFSHAEKLREDAQNALLKTLEEPPEGAYILFLAPDRHAFLPTVLSRMTEHRHETKREIADTSKEIFGALGKGDLTRAFTLFDDEDIAPQTLLTDLSALVLEDGLRAAPKTAIMKETRMKLAMRLEELALRAATPVNDRILLAHAFYEITEEYR